MFKPNIFGSRSLGFAKTEPRRSTWNWFKSNSSMFAASNAPSQSVGLAFITNSRGIESESLEGAAEICHVICCFGWFQAATFRVRLRSIMFKKRGGTQPMWKIVLILTVPKPLVPPQQRSTGLKEWNGLEPFKNFNFCAWNLGFLQISTVHMDFL